MKTLNYINYVLKYIIYLFKLAYYYLFKKNKKRAKFLKKGLIAFSLSIVFFLTYLIITKPQEVAAWWNESWLYRKSIQITNNTSEESDVYVSVEIDTSDTDKFQGDCGDLRFTKNNGQLLPYYISSGCGTGTTTIHVNFDTFPAGTQTIYYYYGNPSAEDGFESSDFTAEASDYSVGSQGSEEQSIAPIAYYRLDEGYGSTINDSIHNYGGTLGAGNSAPSWQNESMSLSGKSLSFDGSNDYVSIGSTIPDIKSVSFWAKPNTTTEYFLELNDSASISVSSGTISATGFTSPTIYVDGKQTTTLTDNQWQFITVTTDTTITGSAINLGKISTNYYQGFLDEIKFYQYAQSNSQIKTSYNAHSGSQSNTSIQIGAPNPNNSLSNGLIAYWKLDEGIWDGTTDEVIDYSGNSYHGTGVGTTSPTVEAGKFGNAGIFNGSDNYVDLNDAQIIDYTKPFTISYWSYIDSYSNDHSPTILNIKTNVASSEFAVFYTDTDWSGYDFTGLNISDISIGLRVKTVGDISDDFVGTWKHVVIVYDGNNSTKDDVVSYKIYIDGVAQSLVNAASHVWATGDGSYIGSDTAVDDYTDGKINELRIYNRTFSPKEVRELYEWAPGPIAHWKFDEGTGDTTYDTSGNGNDVTFGASTAAPSWTNGKIGKGLSFDGSNDYTRVSSFSEISDYPFTLSIWTKYSGDGNETLFSLASTTSSSLWYSIWTSTDLKPRAGIRNGTDTNAVASTTVMNDNKWHFLTAVFESSTSRKIYVDGVLEGTDTTSVAYNSNMDQVHIGNLNTCCYTTGKLDEAKIYNYARTPKQIIEDMLGSTKPSGVGGNAVKGAIAHYKFDEGYGSTANNSGLLGDDLNGTLGSSAAAPTWTNSGKLNKALDFNSTDSEYVDIGDLGTNIQSICFWAKLDSTTEKIIDFDGGTHYIQASGGTVSAEGFTSPTIYIDGKSSTTIDTDWHHICITTDTSFDANDATIGQVDTDYLDGILDELKIYNYALTKDEMIQNFSQGKSTVLGSVSTTSDGITPSNSASRAYCIPGDTSTCNPPVGEWKMDKGSGSTTYDTSGNEYNGTLGTGNSAPEWKTGKIGKSLKFDGSNDYVSLGNPSGLKPSSITIESWIYPISGPDRATIVSQGWNTGYHMSFISGSDFYIWLRSRGDYSFSDVLETGSWQHVAFTYDENGVSDNLVGYVNGKKVGSTTFVGALSYWTNETRIGTRGLDGSGGGGGGYHFPGTIDEVKIYDYARTPAQIAWDYNRGKSIFHYKLDECQGTTAYNSARNSNDEDAGTNGTITIGGTGSQSGVGTCEDGASTSAWYNGLNGKYSSSLNFDGTDDYIDVGDTTREDIYAVSFWAKPNSTTESILELTASDSIGISSGTVSVTGFGTETIYVDGVENFTFPDTSWHHITVISDTAIDADAVNFGKEDTIYYQGQLDDIQIFNYELTSTQIKTLYNRGAVSFGE